MPEPATCEATITVVIEPDVGPETLNYQLDPGHDGHHRDGTTTWGWTKILNRRDPADA